MTTKLIIVGAGGHGRSVAEAVLLQRQFELIGFIDDFYPAKQTVWDIPILAKTDCDFAQFYSLADSAIVAIGNNEVRERLQNRLFESGFDIATVIHPAAIVSPRAVVGAGCTIMAGAIVGTDSTLGNGVIVNSGAVIDHDCHVSDYAHLGVGACMAGGGVLGSSAWMQAGSSIGYRTIVPANEIVATNSRKA